MYHYREQIAGQADRWDYARLGKEESERSVLALRGLCSSDGRGRQEAQVCLVPLRLGPYGPGQLLDYRVFPHLGDSRYKAWREAGVVVIFYFLDSPSSCPCTLCFRLQYSQKSRSCYSKSAAVSMVSECICIAALAPASSVTVPPSRPPSDTPVEFLPLNNARSGFINPTQA